MNRLIARKIKVNRVLSQTDSGILPPQIQTIKDGMIARPLSELKKSADELAKKKKSKKVFRVRSFSFLLAETIDRHNYFRENNIDVFQRVAQMNRICDPTGEKARKRVLDSLDLHR